MSDTAVADDGRMTLIEHLAELRRRIIISFAAIAIGAIVGWFAYFWILDQLLRPYCELTPDCGLLITDPVESFTVRLSVAGYTGLAIAMPVILWQLWRFVAPGLYKHEKRYAVSFISGAVALFFLGCGLAYWSIPKALEFLQDVGGDNFTEFYSPNRYLSFVIKMTLAFGIGFEFPIVLIFLQLVGLVNNRTLRAGRQYAIVGVVALVAVLTPSGDPFSLTILSIPMYLFYELAIFVGWMQERRRTRAAGAGA